MKTLMVKEGVIITQIAERMVPGNHGNSSTSLAQAANLVILHPTVNGNNANLSIRVVNCWSLTVQEKKENLTK